MNIGDYCLATKYDDGEGWDGWAVGFYVGEIFPGRHQVSDKDGKTWRANGFRRCEPITREQGDFLIASKDWIEQVGFKLWDYIHPPKVRDHRAGPSDQGRAEQAIVAGSGASPCWADGVIDGSKS